MTNLKNQERERIVLPRNTANFVESPPVYIGWHRSHSAEELRENQLVMGQNETCQQIYALWLADRTTSIDTLLNTIELQFGKNGLIYNIETVFAWFCAHKLKPQKEKAMQLACEWFKSEFINLMRGF